MDYEFRFTLQAALPVGEYNTINYPQEDGFSLAVTYNRKYDNLPSYKINLITINKILASDTNVPSAMGAAGPRERLSSKSLQINYNNIIMSGNCTNLRTGNILPEISIGQTACLKVEDLVDDGSTNLTINSCKLTIEKQTYTVTPTGYSDNKITNANCKIEIIASGGHRRKRRATQKARRKNRRLSRRNK